MARASFTSMCTEPFHGKRKRTKAPLRDSFPFVIVRQQASNPLANNPKDMPKTTRRKVRPDLMRQTEAARLLECHRNTVLAMYSRGELGGEYVAGVLFVDRGDVERVAAEREAARLAKAS